MIDWNRAISVRSGMMIGEKSARFLVKMLQGHDVSLLATPVAACDGRTKNAFQAIGERDQKSNHINCLDGDLAGNGQASSKRIAVVLGYFNGEQYLPAQLRSIFQQTHCALHVFLYDDGSQKAMDVNQLSLGDEDLERLSITARTQNLGPTRNFLNALEDIDQGYEFFAFSDQDDVWRDNKLERAIAALSQHREDVPALYCSRTEIADSTCQNSLGYSPLFRRAPCFANALVQNMGGGNTMVFNKAARDLIVASSRDTQVVSHDWWTYLIVSGAGGEVIYDPEPTLVYRQHQGNLVGTNIGLQAHLTRLKGLGSGVFRRWNDINVKALSCNRHLLTAQNKKLLETFVLARKARFFKRLAMFRSAGIHRQTLLGNLGLWAAIIFKTV